MFRSVNSFFKMVFSSAKQTGDGIKTIVYKKGFTPSYVLIAKDLESGEPQIFEAAVYYLCTIAAFKKAYRADILDILKREASQNKAHAGYIEKIMHEKKLV